MQWGTAPLTPASLTHANLTNSYGPASTFAPHQPQKFHQRKRTNDQFFEFQGNHVLGPTPPTTAHSYASSLQPFGDMEGILKDSDYSPIDDDINGSQHLTAAANLQLPDDFGEVLEPSVSFPNQYSGRTIGSSTPTHFTATRASSQRSSPRPKLITQEPPATETWLTQTSVLEHHAVVSARESWSYFKCNPRTSRNICPKTARIHLEGLEQTLKSREAWQQRDLLPEIVKPASNRLSTKVEPFNSFTRDKLLAITQIFLHKASKIHYSNNSNRQSPTDMESTGFIVLPPPNVLEHFLEAFVYHFEPHYPSVPAGLLNANDLMRVGNPKTASLLLLLMIALGASATPNVEARFLTSGLIESCRISLFDYTEKNVDLIEDLINMLRCGLLFTIAAVWSGDKWHMDVSLSFPPRFLRMGD